MYCSIVELITNPLTPIVTYAVEKPRVINIRYKTVLKDDFYMYSLYKKTPRLFFWSRFSKKVT